MKATKNQPFWKKTSEEKPHWKEEKISKEEKKYQYACQLMESVDCVTRFERKVLSLQRAAELFEQLGGYKESAAMYKRCLELAEQDRQEGIEQTYQETLMLEKEAVTKLDYKTVIAEYSRIPDYKDAEARIEECKKKIKHLETVSVWKNRGIAIAILAVLFVIFWISPAKPYTKGMIHKHQEKYNLAIANFEEAGDFINSSSMIRSCRYQQARKAYDKQQYPKALRLCRQAYGNADAEKMGAWLEGNLLAEKAVGDNVRFGGKKWVVLDKSTEQHRSLLLLDGGYRSHIYNKETAEWEKSWIRRWLRKQFNVNNFTSSEKKLLLETVDGEIYTAEQTDTEETVTVDKTFLLNEEQFAKWKDRIPAGAEWWLRSDDASQVIWVDEANQIQKSSLENTEKNIRPAIWVSWHPADMEEQGLKP